ncbi:hypothetical protein N7539_000910 [Penicillium diatomitis]|uniref:Uncharacterized protein n=1 Tax=Penicillium diatomitis TaxID=2819901 RepID=A0A9W9XMP0_9EURO|nr:uncharacterized protein N7539_000910 [Penicillium diatomitis]KAJ5495794.1 hypothetical protein N7539_000910 [Penicillium diatomitis]
MGLLRTAALVVLGISAFVFVALFGRLPVFRKTPIAFFHRLLWVHLPGGIAWIDSHLFGGRIVHAWNRSGSYILHENHPLVLVRNIPKNDTSNMILSHSRCFSSVCSASENVLLYQWHGLGFPMCTAS